MSSSKRTNPNPGSRDVPSLADVAHPDDHISHQVALRAEPVGDAAIGRFTVHPSMWGVGMNRPRLSIIALAIDELAGQIPTPVRFPTVDLRAHLLADPPSEGLVEIMGRPLRVGGRLIVSEFEVADAAGDVFGHGTATMFNRHHLGYVPPEDAGPSFRVASLDSLLNARVVDERSLELDPNPRIANGIIPTPNGGAQMVFCELAAEHLMGWGSVAVDLDLYFLQPGEVGPIRATATHTGTVGGLDMIRVDLTDTGADGALVAAATILSRPPEGSERP